jgi:hypothetical protein
MSQPVCPNGYFPITGDTSNCSTSTSATIVSKICPSGTTLQANGLCGTGNTFPLSGPTYCGPQYTGKNCTYQQQLTPGMTVATGTESTNMICAFREGDSQFPCDPGCCGPPLKETGGDGTSGNETGPGSGSTEPGFPVWAIILLTVLGSVIFAVFLAWAAKKMSRKSSNGTT